MSNENQTLSENPKSTHAVDIRSEVKSRIASSAPQIKSTIINNLADAEIAKRVDTITKALVKRDGLEKELGKIKADIVSYNEDGTVAASNFSKPVLDSRAKLTKEFNEVTEAINNALDKNDYEKLNKIVG